jgi:cytochrome c-type protein NapB
MRSADRKTARRLAALVNRHFESRYVDWKGGLMSSRMFVCLMLVAASACGVDENSNYGKYTRAEVRYYAYAPPLIPHEVINKNCLACHADGMVVQGVKAPVSPHPDLVNCQQCHIRADDGIQLFKANSFTGLAEPGPSDGFQPDGPPLISHRVFMRENCHVCHNDPDRKEIVQTTHPERLNCLQCHIEQKDNVTAFNRN